MRNRSERQSGKRWLDKSDLLCRAASQRSQHPQPGHWRPLREAGISSEGHLPKRGTANPGSKSARAGETLRLPIIEEGHKKNAFPRFDHFFKHKI